ncbi:hypothetical protein TWF192_002375 [Orbilia oligospora]|nr:hypothetical protein TWF192_002375 [Orbilia oligospora]
MCEIVRRLGVVPEIDDEVKFGLKVEVMREFPRTGCQPKECQIKLFAIQSSSSSSRYAGSKPRGQEEQTKFELLTETAEISPRPGSGADQQTLHLKRHFVIPLSTFAIEDDGNQRFASSGYEIICRIWLGQAGEGVDLAEDTSGERSYETRLRLDENLVCNDGQSETTVAAVKTGEVELDTDTDLDLETLQLKLSFGWNKSINYQILGNGKKKQRQQQQNTSNVVLVPKRRKQIRIDYTFRGHVKNFDEQDAHKHSTVNLNDKLYRIEKSSFSSAGQEFLKLWGGHVMVEGPRSSHHLHDCLIRFCRLNKKALKPTPLRQEFDKFVTALRLRGQVDRMLVKECKKVLDST